MNTVDKIKHELQKAVIGQETMIEGMLIALLCEGHLLIEGVPGLAKTTAVNALASALGLDFKRIQFTPDLLPSDLIGTQIYNPKTQEFFIKKGPLFTHLLLADEINRAPAKVQSALLEVMQERRITIAEETFGLDAPFMVLATQNPIEQEGVYPLPEAQLDRFMMKIVVDYNDEDEELAIMQKAATKSFKPVMRVADAAALQEAQKALEAVHTDDEVARYIVALVAATRNPQKYGVKALEGMLRYGASPRASIDLYKASRAQAFLRGNDHVTPTDIAMVAPAVLRHRLVLSYEARAKRIDPDTLIRELLQAVPVP
jgi:MoxR-like ATPase